MTEAPPTWEELSADPRFAELPPGEQMGVLDQWSGDVKAHLGEAYDEAQATPYLDQRRAEIAARGQSPLSTMARTIGTGLVQSTAGTLGSAGRFLEDAAQGIGDLTGLPGGRELGRAMVRSLPGALPVALAAPVAEEVNQEAQAIYAPDTQLNPIAATVGSAVGQAPVMLASAVAAGPAGPLILGATQGYGEGSQMAHDLGVENPLGRMALGAGFGAVETLAEKAFGLGSGPLKQAAGEMIDRLASQGVKTILGEAVEEPLAGIGQDTLSLAAAKAVEDPTRPGFTTTGLSIDQFKPDNVEYWQRRKLEAIGGAAGGTVFAGFARLANGQRIAPTPGTAPDQAPDLSDDLGELTADDVADLEAQVSPPPTGSTTPAPGTPAPAVGPESETPGSPLSPESRRPSLSTTSIEDSAMLVSSGEDSTAVNPPDPESITNIGSRAVATFGQTQDRPLAPANPLGTYDAIDFLNENPVAPLRQDATTGGEMDWTEAISLPPTVKSQITSKTGGQPLDVAAQQAYEANLIAEPTAEALMARVAQDVAQRRQFGPRAASAAPKPPTRTQARAFEDAQRQLASGSSQAVPVDTLRQGDRLTLGGKPVTVQSVQTDDQGRNTQVTLDGGQDFGQLVLNNEGNFLLADAAPDTTGRPAGSSPAALEADVDAPFSPARSAAVRNERGTRLQMEAVGLPVQPGSYQGGARLIRRALSVIVGDRSQPATMRMMAEMLSKRDLNNLFLRVEADGRKLYAGLYQPFQNANGQLNGQGELSLNLRGHAPGQTVAETLVHEVLHHATYRALRNPRNNTQKQAAAALDTLRRSLKQQPGADRWTYALSKVDEFISNLYTIPQFQVWLSQQPAPQGLGAKFKNALAAIFNKIAQLVTGRVVTPGSALDVAFAESLTLIEETGVGDNQTGDNGTRSTAQQSPTRRAVTPEQDAEYLAAVEAGDMVKAQRMVDDAARAAGYNVGPVWHGTKGNRFDVFDPAKGSNMAYGPGFYFAESEERARLFGDNLITAYLKIDGLEQRRGTGVQLGDNGYRTKLGDWVVKLDYKSSIKSADPVTRDESGQVIPLSERFNPESDSILYSPTRAPEGMRETRSRFAPPKPEDRFYETREDVEVMATADRWLAGRTLEQAVAEMEAGMRQDDWVQAAAGRLLEITADLMTNGTELEQAKADALNQRMSKVWAGPLSQEAARALRQRGIVNDKLVPFAPIMAARGALIDRAEAIVRNNFEGGAAGGAAAVQTAADLAGTEASQTLATDLDAAEPVTAAEQARVAELERQLQTARQDITQLRNAGANFQRLLEIIKSAGLQKAKVLSLTMQKAMNRLRMARAMAANRASGGPTQQSPTGGQPSTAANAAAPIDNDLALAVATVQLNTSLDFNEFQAALVQEFGPAITSQLNSLYTQASGLILQDATTAAAEVKAAPKPKKGKSKTPPPQLSEAEQRVKTATKVAESLVNQLALRHADPTIWPDQKQEHPVRKLYRQHLKQPMADFAARLEKLGVTASEAAKLERAASMEIKAQEAYDRIKLLEQVTNPDFLRELLDNLRSKILPGVRWADIFSQLPSDQKARQLAMYERLLKDQRFAGLSQSERLELTNALDRAWQQERRKVFRRELEKQGVIQKAKPANKAKLLATYPKLLRWINLGVMDAEAFRAAIAPQFGLRTMSAAEAAKLRTMAEEAYRLPEGLLRGRKLAQMLASMQKVTGLSRAELLNSYWTASVLSGFRTQFVIAMGALNGLLDIGLLSANLALRGKGRAAVQAQAAWARGFTEGLRDSWQIIAKGDYSILKRFNEDLAKSLAGESKWRPVPLGEALWQNGNAWSKAPAAVMMFTGRLMAALDHITNTASTEGAKVVARALHPELYANAAPTADERASARQQALQEITGGSQPTTSADAAAVRVRVREILAGVLDPATFEEASFIGDQSAMQNKPVGVLGELYTRTNAFFGGIEASLEKAANSEKVWPSARATALLLGAIIRPITGVQFLRAGFNVGNQFLSFMPGTAVLSLARQAAFNAPMTRSQNALLIGRNVAGFLLSSALIAALVEKDDEEEGWHLEGNWQSLSKEQKALRRSAGLEPGTLWKRENGQIIRYSYRDNPMAGIMVSVGNAQDLYRHDRSAYDSRGVIEHILRGYAAGLLQVKDANAIGTLMETLGSNPYAPDPTDDMLKALIKLPKNFVGGLIPTAVKDAEIWTDPRLYRPEGIFSELLSQVPGLRTSQNGGMPSLDRLGNEIQLNRAPWSRFVTSTPSGLARANLANLMARGLDLPMASPRKLITTKDGARITIESLGPKAVHAYAKATGQRWQEFLSSPEGSALLKMPAEQAQNVINDRDRIIKLQALTEVPQ